MKKRNKFLIATIGGIVLASGITACGHYHDPEARADHMVERITKKLELTEPQVTQLQHLKDELLTVRREMAAEREQLSDTVVELLSQPTLDQQRILQLVRERTDAVNRQAPQIVTALAGFYDSLDGTQQEALRDKVEAFKAHRHHRHHRSSRHEE